MMPDYQIGSYQEKIGRLRDISCDALRGQTLLVKGSSGWFGKALTGFLDVKKIEVIFLQSREEVKILKRGEFVGSTPSKLFNETVDVCMDLAFETKEKMSSNSTSKEAQNGNKALLDEVETYLSSRRFGRYIGFSSGAALSKNVSDPYGQAKASLEQIYLDNRAEVDRMARVWSVSGAFCTKPQLFAFSDFIQQAVAGNSINVTSTRPTYRRYCAIEEVFTLLLSGQCPPLFDSGGTLVELGELAKIIGQVINPGASVLRGSIEDFSPKNYFSHNSVFEKCMADLDLEALTIEEQVVNARRGLPESRF